MKRMWNGVISGIVGCIVLSSIIVFPQAVHAVTSNPSSRPTPLTATSSSFTLTATSSANATSSAEIEQKIQQKQEKDITQPSSQVKSKLAAYLDQQPRQPLSPLTIVQFAIRRAVDVGVPANILVLLLLFPLTASLIAAFRHIFGLRGFGVYTPAVLAVAFVSTGILTGLIVFALIFIATTVARMVMNKFKIQYLPRAALLLWFVSLVSFTILLLTPYISVPDLASVGIFPLLVLVLLSENFLEAQISMNLRRALSLTLETLFLAIVSALVMRTLAVQQFVIRYPELIILGVLIVDIAVGRYTGLRISEIFRFKSLLESEE